MAATLLGVMAEEQGHAVASVLEQRMGIADFRFDEGGLAARSILQDFASSGSEVKFDLNIGGSVASLATSADAINSAIDTQFSSARLLSDRQMGSMEFSSTNQGMDQSKLIAYFKEHREEIETTGISLDRAKELGMSVEDAANSFSINYSALFEEQGGNSNPFLVTDSEKSSKIEKREPDELDILRENNQKLLDALERGRTEVVPNAISAKLDANITIKDKFGLTASTGDLLGGEQEAKIAPKYSFKRGDGKVDDSGSASLGSVSLRKPASDDVSVEIATPIPLTSVRFYENGDPAVAISTPDVKAFGDKLKANVQAEVRLSPMNLLRKNVPFNMLYNFNEAAGEIRDNEKK